MGLTFMTGAGFLSKYEEVVERWLALTPYFHGLGPSIAIVSTISVLQSFSALPALYLIRYAINVAIPEGQIRTLLYIGLTLVGIRLVFSLLSLLARVFSLRVGRKVIRLLRTDLLADMYRRPIDYFRHNDAARLQTRIVIETERLDNLTSSVLPAILTAVVSSGVLLAVLVTLNPWLTAMLALFFPMVWFSARLTGRGIQREVKAFQSDFESFSEGVQFVLRQMELTRVRGFENDELETQSGKVRALESSGIRMGMSFAFHSQVQSNLVGLGGLLLLVVGGMSVVDQTMMIGDLVAFYLAAGMLNGQIGALTGSIPEIIAGNESLIKISDLRMPKCSRDVIGKKRVSFQGTLELRDVGFGFGDKPLLAGIDLAIIPGEVLSIVGPNGSGKSTIVNLVLGFYRPRTGCITIDGNPYPEIDLAHLRRGIGLVPQRPTFFTGSVRDNIAYGWPDVSHADIELAASIAGAKGFIDTLPEGLESRIGEGGTLVSGGEAQKLAIARALVGQPGLLILDEPTNHLDVRSIGEIMQRLSHMDGKPALLIISHDPAIAPFCDRILELTGGILCAASFSPQSPIIQQSVS